MEHDVMHDLPLDQAKQLARRALQSYAERFGKYSPTLQWRTDTEADIKFEVTGAALSGALTVQADRFHMQLDVPLLLRPFSGLAIKVIEREVRGWIDKAKTDHL